LTNLVAEYDVSILVFLTTEASLVNQPVMEATELYQVIETGLAAIGPNLPALVFVVNWSVQIDL